ncbi:aminotransferase class V-fold PLP-dependent enzyme [soil metagenome]
MLKPHFSRFLASDPERLHFAAHSHHYWPDVTRDAQLEAWDLAAELADGKWGPFFDGPWKEAHTHVARILGLGDGTSLAFAPNTHELVVRILSCLPRERPPRILTTDGEFHSFARQLARLEEDESVQVTRISAEPFATFVDRFVAAARSDDYDLLWTSQVFFDSGYAVDVARLVEALRDHAAAIVVDGYHGFMAIETDLSAIADRAFYLAGAYKYAMAGEGACFLHAPPSFFPRPPNTGWFAAFFAIETARGSGPVPYPVDGSRFLGATFDPTAIFRFNAVQRFLLRESVSVKSIAAHAHALQRRFAFGLAASTASATFSASDLVVPLDEPRRGAFLTFRRPAEEAKRLHDLLAAAKIVTDVRGDRLRFGFGPYHDEADVDRGVERIAALLSR